MKIYGVDQLSFEKLASDLDLIVAASGYESRAVYVAKLLESVEEQPLIKLVFSFVEHSDKCARPANDAEFDRMGYESRFCHGGSDKEVVEAFKTAVDRIRGIDSPRILIDISSMTRVWYGAIVRVLNTVEFKGEIEVYFAYTAAEFVAPPDDYPPNRVVAPVTGFTGNAMPDKPTALVLGLGYDKDRAIGLKDHLDPQLSVLFYADPASDDRYVPHVLGVNRDLIEEAGENRIFNYSFRECAMTFRVLESVCSGLTHDWRVVVCSLGPKIFGLCCFLVASIYNDISIWRVSADSHESPFDHKASGAPIILKTLWKGV